MNNTVKSSIDCLYDILNTIGGGFDRNTYYMHYRNIFPNHIDFEYTSDKVLISKEQLNKVLQKYNFYLYLGSSLV